MNELNTLEGFSFMKFARKLYSGMTAAPRLVNSIITWEEFEIFDDQSIKDSLKDSFTGQTAVASLILGSYGLDNLSLGSNEATTPAQTLTLKDNTATINPLILTVAAVTFSGILFAGRDKTVNLQKTN